MKYTKDAKQLLDALGGKENIVSVTHCATRLRFVLQDNHLPDISSIQKLSSVKGVFNQAGQFQVIIGNDVATFYNELQPLLERKEEFFEFQKFPNHKTFLQKMMTFLSEVFAPLIPAIIMGGFLLGLSNYLTGISIDDWRMESYLALFKDNPTMKMMSELIRMSGELIFYFLPVGIIWSVTKKMGTTQIIGIVLGVCVVAPTLFEGSVVGYPGQVLPSLLAGITLSITELRLRRWIPESIAMLVVPFCSFLVTLILTFTLLAPIGNQLGHWIAKGIYQALTGSFGWLIGTIVGSLYAPFVMTGLHHLTTPIDLQLQVDFGGTVLWPLIALSNIAQGSSVLALYWIYRHDRRKEAMCSAMISCYLGVTEPALFGINMKYRYSFVAGIVGTAIASLMASLFKVTATTIGVGGLPGILSIQRASVIPFILCSMIAIVVSFMATMLFKRMNWFKPEVER